ncbi:hypothetical protein [aff. Roholtiella sp. LEGE 12411]|uniref:hypothetical protein n=1 Tax=aff. Roholtiella sp. LEGE 12411 TaxID=1828822 RepID=UPI0018805487|nr:hypothetical protein [aff. Roholtiella sp. LEGE 12411]MBE9038224.1 hypothetical protein [aff. Roholtiella sp. LEGE 12411]
MSNKNSKSHNSSTRETFKNAESPKTALLANRLTPTNNQITDWLRSPQIKQWLIKLPMGITNALKTEMVNTIIINILDKPDKDCRVQYSGAAIGVDVLRWQLWASYKLPYASAIKAPDCPYTLKKHLEEVKSIPD